MEDFLSALLVIAFSTVKFLTGVTASLVAHQGLIPSYIYTVGGGVLGVFIFSYAGEHVAKWFDSLFPNRKRKKFSTWKRFIVKIKKTFGLPGVAMLTPILSIPIGIFLSLSLTKNKWRIAFFMFISFLIWATFIFVPYYLFEINIGEAIKSLL